MSKKVSPLFATRSSDRYRLLFKCIKKLKNKHFNNISIPKFDKSIDDRLPKKMAKSNKKTKYSNFRRLVRRSDIQKIKI